VIVTVPAVQHALIALVVIAKCSKVIGSAQTVARKSLSSHLSHVMTAQSAAAIAIATAVPHATKRTGKKTQVFK